MLINSHKFLNCFLQVIPRRTITLYTQLSTHWCVCTYSGVWITSSPLLGVQILAGTSRGRCGCCHFMRNHEPYNPQCTPCTCWKTIPEQCTSTRWAIRLSAGCRLKTKLVKLLFKFHNSMDLILTIFNSVLIMHKLLQQTLMLRLSCHGCLLCSLQKWPCLIFPQFSFAFSLKNMRAAGTMATANLDSCKKRNRLQSKTPKLCVKTQIRQIWNLLEEYSACQHFCELFQNVNANWFFSNCFRHSKVVWSCFSQNDNRVFWNEAWYIFHRLRN